jgi:bacterioferritin (cytochrome b1)
MKPSLAQKSILRVASAVERAERPSLSKLSAEIGKVVLALEEGDPSAEVVVKGSSEGSLAVPTGQLIAHLQKWLGAKYRIDAAYRSFADRVKGPWRDSLVEHWTTHAGEERQAAYDLAMKIVGLGGDPNVTIIEVPQTTPNLGALCAVLMGLEVKAIEAARETMSMSGDRVSLRVLAENICLVDTAHLDDLTRMCVGMAS